MSTFAKSSVTIIRRCLHRQHKQMMKKENKKRERESKKHIKMGKSGLVHTKRVHTMKKEFFSVFADLVEAKAIKC